MEAKAKILKAYETDTLAALGEEEAAKYIKEIDTRAMSTEIDLAEADLIKLGNELEAELGVSVHQEVPTMQTLLCYYQLPACTGPLAVARFTCRNDKNEIIEVSEERYSRSSKEEERFQDEVVDSMECGIDCFVISGQPAESFPKIAALLADPDTDVIG